MTRRFLAATAAALAGASAALCGTPALAADATRDQQWHLGFLNVAEAQRISTGKGVTVAVIDSGVSSHPDLAGSVLKGTDLIRRGGDGSTDRTGHGTAMAGLIAAHGKNGRGALGIAPDAKILPIRTLEGKTQKAPVGPAIDYAIAHGAKVINLSLSGGIDPEALSAVDSAEEADVVVVAGVGNKPDAFTVQAPAIIDSVVAVGAVDNASKKAKISVSGKALDLMAPGEDIMSTDANGGFRTGTGTSGSTAIVSGAVALIRSKYPNMTAAEVRQRLESTATDKGAPGVDDDYGHGVLNIVAALSDRAAAPSASASAAAPAPATTTTAAPAPQAKAEPASSNTPLIAGGVAVLVLLGGLGAFLLTRRRSRPAAAPAPPPDHPHL